MDACSGSPCRESNVGPCYPLPTQDEHLQGLGKIFIICNQASSLAQTVDNLTDDEIYFFITHHEELGANF